MRMRHASLTYYTCTTSGTSTVQLGKCQPLTKVYSVFVDESLEMDSKELDSQRRQERLRRRRQREDDARARETAEQREARLARGRERYRAERRQESQHTRQAQMDANRAAQRLRRRLPKQGKNVCSITGQSNALGGKQRLLKQGRNVSSITGQPNALGEKQRLPKQGRNVCSITAGQPNAALHSGGAHGPSHVVLQETVYKQRLLQLAQARPTMPAFTSTVCMYVWYDRHPRRRSYTIHCAHSKIFRAIQTACCNVCVLHCASVQHTLPRVQASFKRFSSSRDR